MRIFGVVVFVLGVLNCCATFVYLFIYAYSDAPWSGPDWLSRGFVHFIVGVVLCLVGAAMVEE